MGGKGIGEVLSRFHHIGVLVRSLEEAIDHYQAMGFGPFQAMGLKPTDRKVFGRPDPDTVNVAKITTIGPVMVEFVQPVAGRSVQREWLDSRGEGVNHICFAVDDIEEATAIMAEEGFQPISSCRFEGGGGMAYFDTDRVGGVQFELLEAPPKNA